MKTLDRPSSKSSGSRHGTASLSAVDEDTGDEGDENADIFSAFKFTSFRTKNLVDENYEMVHLKDPDEPIPISAPLVFPKEKVEKEAIEVVPINAEELAKQ